MWKNNKKFTPTHFSCTTKHITIVKATYISEINTIINFFGKFTIFCKKNKEKNKVSFKITKDIYNNKYEK